MTPTPIRIVGRYELLEVVGRGGAAVVYLAYQTDLRRRIALKELAPFQAAVDPTFAGRFAEESRVAGSLSHPNIVTVHEYFEYEGVPYIAMEYLSQGSLRPYVGTLTLAQVAGVLEGVLAGLAHGQSRSVVHRDLKPENLLVTADGRVKIGDFGVARAYADAVTRPVVTAVGTTIGTPAYMAPEQALGREVGPAADLYSLGIIAWELLIGRVPFEEKDTPVAVLYKHVHEAIPPARSVAPDIDPRIEAWLERMLAKDPEGRFPSAESAWEQLEDVVLELLGPRWRRDARLPVVETAVAGRPLAPAMFNDGAGSGAAATSTPPGTATPPPPSAPAGAPPPSGPAPAADAPPPRAEPTLDGVPSLDPPATFDPPLPAPGGRPTIHRLARRHDLEEEGPEQTPERSRLGLAIAALVTAIIVAAALGVVLGSAGASHPKAARTTTNNAPATEAAQVVAVLQGVAAARATGIRRLNAAHSAAAQAAAAAAVERAYATGVDKLAALPLVTRNAALTRSIDGTLARLDHAYRSLAADARSLRKQRYASELALIGREEKTLRAETTALA
jgi:serine/threonine protein kinase